MDQEKPVEKNEKYKDVRILEAVFSVILFVSVCGLIIGHTFFLTEIEHSSFNYLKYSHLILLGIGLFWAVINFIKTIKVNGFNSITIRRFAFIVFVIVALWLNLRPHGN